MEEFETPNSDVSHDEEIVATRNIYFMILVNMYFWWKLIDYVSLWLFPFDSIMEAILLGLNIPVYISVMLYIFKIRLLPRLFWKIWIVIAILDEIRMNVVDYEGIYLMLYYALPIVPLYILGVVYAYKSPYIWDKSDN